MGTNGKPIVPPNMMQEANARGTALLNGSQYKSPKTRATQQRKMAGAGAPAGAPAASAPPGALINGWDPGWAKVLENWAVSERMGAGNTYQDPADQTKAGMGEKVTAMGANQLMSGPGMLQGVAANATGALSKAGKGEAGMGALLDQTAAPGLGESTSGTLVGQNMGKVNDNAQTDYFSQFMSERPDINYDAGLDPFYDNAQRKALEGVNQNAASRGAYGSSAALDMGNEAITNLRAEQANREADYYLRALGEGRQWAGLGGDLAQNADASSRDWMGTLADVGVSGQQVGLDRIKTGIEGADTMDRLGMDRFKTSADIASDADRTELERVTGAADIALSGQRAGDDRIQRTLDNKLGMGEIGADTARSYYADVFQGDEINWGSAHAAEAAGEAARLQAAGVKLAGIAKELGTTTANVTKLLTDYTDGEKK